MSLEKIEEIHKEIVALQTKLQNEGAALIEQAFIDFLKAVPEIESIYWTQYTPHFNDGDTCRFNVHDFEVELNGKVEDEDSIYDKVYQFEHKIASRDLFLAAFGDHKSITATADGLKIMKYTDHH